MFATFKQIFRSSNKDLRIRILFTLGVLLIFAIGNSITIPGMNVIDEDLGFLELFNAMSGGGLKQFSIFALGVMPYITASIIIQILQMDIIPYFKDLKEMGEEGRRKIAKITRYSINMGYITYDDLFKFSEKKMFEKFDSIKDSFIEKLLIDFRTMTPEKTPHVELPNVKSRDINPLVNGKRLKGE